MRKPDATSMGTRTPAFAGADLKEKLGEHYYETGISEHRDFVCPPGVKELNGDGGPGDAGEDADERIERRQHIAREKKRISAIRLRGSPTRLADRWQQQRKERDSQDGLALVGRRARRRN